MFVVNVFLGVHMYSVDVGMLCGVRMCSVLPACFRGTIMTMTSCWALYVVVVSF